jgi:glutaredoxin 3
MNYFTIYTKPGCAFCTKAKRLVEEKGDTFIEKDASEPDIRVELLAKFPGATMVPQIEVNADVLIGGYEQLEEWYAIRAGAGRD